MERPNQRLPSTFGLLALGGLYVVLGGFYPLVPMIDEPANINAIMVVLVAGPGLVLLTAGYQLPKTDIAPEAYPIVTKWCLGGIGAMLGLVGFVAVAGEVQNPVQNVLILTALGSLAGLAAGTYDARARTRTVALERRNEELQQTQAKLEATVEKLATSEQRYRTLTENFPNGIVALLDDEFRHRIIAGRGLEQAGLDPEALRGERIHDTYPADFVEQLIPHFRATLTGEPQTFVAELAGQIYEFRSHPLAGDGTTGDAILVMTQDVTHRVAYERELSRRASQQQTIADLGQLALETDDLDELMGDASRLVADALNTDYCNVMDLDPGREELLLRQGVGWKDGATDEATVSAVGQRSQAAYTLEHDQPVVVEDLEAETRFSGSTLLLAHDVRSGISTTIGPSEDPWGILGTYDTEQQAFSDEDVSFIKSVANIITEAIEREQYERELERLVADLEESNTRLEQFAYAASHDLQEPLRMVSSYLQLIEERYRDDLDEDGLEFLEFAVDGADRMRSMIDGLLKYSRVETEAESFEPVDLDGVFEDVRADLQVTIEETDATIAVESLPRVEGDEHQLRQVFQNLLENAIEYSGDEPPEVSVSARPNGTSWTVSVADDGIGIDSDSHDRIFRVFERAHGREISNGTGIGLALCERIVERHGGDIWVEAEPDEGATFSFSLPQTDTPAA